MGWKDYHLHEFIVIDSRTSRVKRIGIPDDEMPDERPCLAGWNVPIAGYLTYETDPVRYRYDFGDDWEHFLTFEELLPTQVRIRAALTARAHVRPKMSAARRVTRNSCGRSEIAGIPSAPPCCNGRVVPSILTRFERAAVVFDDPAERRTAFQQRGRAV